MTSISERRGSLKELVDRFDELVEDFYREHEPRRSSDNFLRGPCLYFHRAAIERIRQESRPFVEWLPGDRHFHETLYAMLTAWGMNQSGARLVDFPDFQRAFTVLVSMGALEEYRSVRLENLTHAKQPLMERLFEAVGDPSQAKIMASGPSVVGGSKLLHHLLPDLIPPMDRTYTKDLLSYLEDENQLRESLDSFNGVWHVLVFFRKVALEIGPDHFYRRWLGDQARYPMNTSIPKIIDNALIAYSWHLWPNG